jgi:hypothetical protein
MKQASVKTYHRSVYYSIWLYFMLFFCGTIIYQVIKQEMYLVPLLLLLMIAFLFVSILLCSKSLYYIFLSSDAMIVKHHLFNTNRVYYFSDIKEIVLKTVRGGVFVYCIDKNNIKRLYVCDTIALNKYHELKEDLLQIGVKVIDKL